MWPRVCASSFWVWATSATDPYHRGYAYIEHRYESFRLVAEGAMRELQDQGEFPESSDLAAAAT